MDYHVTACAIVHWFQLIWHLFAIAVVAINLGLLSLSQNEGNIKDFVNYASLSCKII